MPDIISQKQKCCFLYCYFLRNADENKEEKQELKQEQIIETFDFPINTSTSGDDVCEDKNMKCIYLRNSKNILWKFILHWVIYC